MESTRSRFCRARSSGHDIFFTHRQLYQLITFIDLGIERSPCSPYSKCKFSRSVGEQRARHIAHLMARYSDFRRARARPHATSHASHSTSVVGGGPWHAHSSLMLTVHTPGGSRCRVRALLGPSPRGPCLALPLAPPLPLSSPCTQHAMHFASRHPNTHTRLTIARISSRSGLATGASASAECRAPTHTPHARSRARPHSSTPPPM